MVASLKFSSFTHVLLSNVLIVVTILSFLLPLCELRYRSTATTTSHYLWIKYIYNIYFTYYDPTILSLPLSPTAASIPLFCPIVVMNFVRTGCEVIGSRHAERGLLLLLRRFFEVGDPPRSRRYVRWGFLPLLLPGGATTFCAWWSRWWELFPLWCVMLLLGCIHRWYHLVPSAHICSP